jgi:hypothetical protein
VSCECVQENYGSIKCGGGGGFEQLRACWFLKKYSVA